MKRHSKEYILEQVIPYYIKNKDVTLREIEKIFSVSRYTVSNTLKAQGIKIRNRYHDVELQNYFKSIDSEESAYWLGFIYADGSITCRETGNKRYVLEVCLAEKDKDHILKLRNFIGSKKEIERRESTKSFRLIISSKQLVSNLKNLGIIENKTYKSDIRQILRNIPKEYMRDFIRGFVDGDGHINEQGRFCITSYFKENLISVIDNLPYKVRYKIYTKSTTKACDLRIDRQEDSFKIWSYLYNDATVFLNRKNMIFCRFREKFLKLQQGKIGEVLQNMDNTEITTKTNSLVVL